MNFFTERDCMQNINNKKQNLCNQTVSGPHWILLYFSLIWKTVVTNNCFVANILQNVFFSVQQKEESNSGLETKGK